ncbi:unnamed protein product, partial [Polarella glacialis]
QSISMPRGATSSTSPRRQRIVPESDVDCASGKNAFGSDFRRLMGCQDGHKEANSFAVLLGREKQSPGTPTSPKVQKSDWSMRPSDNVARCAEALQENTFNLQDGHREANSFAVLLGREKQSPGTPTSPKVQKSDWSMRPSDNVARCAEALQENTFNLQDGHREANSFAVLLGREKQSPGTPTSPKVQKSDWSMRPSDNVARAKHCATTAVGRTKIRCAVIVGSGPIGHRRLSIVNARQHASSPDGRSERRRSRRLSLDRVVLSEVAGGAEGGGGSAGNIASTGEANTPPKSTHRRLSVLSTGGCVGPSRLTSGEAPISGNSARRRFSVVRISGDSVKGSMEAVGAKTGNTPHENTHRRLSVLRSGGFDGPSTATAGEAHISGDKTRRRLSVVRIGDADDSRSVKGKASAPRKNTLMRYMSSSGIVDSGSRVNADEATISGNNSCRRLSVVSVGNCGASFSVSNSGVSSGGKSTHRRLSVSCGDSTAESPTTRRISASSMDSTFSQGSVLSLSQIGNPVISTRSRRASMQTPDCDLDAQSLVIEGLCLAAFNKATIVDGDSDSSSGFGSSSGEEDMGDVPESFFCLAENRVDDGAQARRAAMVTGPLAGRFAVHDAFPMFVLPIASLLRFEKLRFFEELMCDGELLEFIPGMSVVYVTHQRSGDKHPESQQRQLSVLQAALGNLRLGKSKVLGLGHLERRSGTEQRMEQSYSPDDLAELAAAAGADGDSFIWIDFCCMPQASAIASSTGENEPSTTDQDFGCNRKSAVRPGAPVLGPTFDNLLGVAERPCRPSLPGDIVSVETSNASCSHGAADLSLSFTSGMLENSDLPRTLAEPSKGKSKVQGLQTTNTKEFSYVRRVMKAKLLLVRQRAFVRAMSSVPSFIERCKYFMILAPPDAHPERTDARLSYESLRSQGWHRLECTARALSLHDARMLLVQDEHVLLTLRSQDFLFQPSCVGAIRRQEAARAGEQNPACHGRAEA